MPESEPRPLHLHTLESLIADLISGRAIETAEGKCFALSDERARSALEWYRKKGPAGWVANVSTPLGEDLVNAILAKPPDLPALPARPANANSRRLRLKKMEAHRFAGLHKFGTPGTPPGNYTHEFSSTLTLLEGRNGSGKTSLLNAVIWTLTGEILRPQREPEVAEDFNCWIPAVDIDGGLTTHKLSPLTPMPNIEQYRPDRAWVPADTWVELTFVDENGVELPKVRRSQGRSPQGRLIETPPDLSALVIDPISIRIGTIMPGLLPLIKVGSESELGRAVSQLTGLSALVDLADHVRRVKGRIDKEFVKARTADRDRADRDYGTAKSDLEKIFAANPNLRPAQAVPQPSDDKGIEEILEKAKRHLKDTKTAAFESARDILGEQFDASNQALLSDLERNVGRALERVTEPKHLRGVARLAALRQLKPEQLDAANAKIQDILAEARALHSLAQDPSTAARTRLYARVATWIADHPDPERKDNMCVVCGGSLEHARDPVTGQLVRVHLHEAAADAALLSQTLGRWAENVHGDLMRNLPESLRVEMANDLPAHPSDLLRSAIVDELFEFEPFGGVLRDLKERTSCEFDEVAARRIPLAEPADITLPEGCILLNTALKRLDQAVRSAQWRQANDAFAREIFVRVLGRPPKGDEPAEKSTLTGKLFALEAIVKSAKPVSDALDQCGRLQQHLRLRRDAEKRLDDYAIASAALEDIAVLGQLADEQVDQLRRILRKDAAAWRGKIYLGAFPDTAHELIDTNMGRKGELDLVVKAGGVSAPAQHVTNASALRASLVAFFLAFWEHVLKERGGFAALLLDDPQELLDDENRERFAAALGALVAVGAQLIVTSYDPRFCARIARLAIAGGVEHLEVHPATRQQPLIRTIPSLPEIERRRECYETDRNAEEPARNFIDSCRVFFEAKLGDMFDDPAHAAWAIANPDPTLATFVQRIRSLVRAGGQGMFSANVFRRFVDHPALMDSSPVIVLMNKAHHGRRQEIRASEVGQCAGSLIELLKLVEKMYEESYRWRRRDAPEVGSRIESVPALVPMSRPRLNVVVCPDLAAFTHEAVEGASQGSLEKLDLHLLDNTVAFYLRRPNFGFAAPQGALAIVEAIPSPAVDRSLVIARTGSSIYARRLVRSASGGQIGLTAEVPDPRTRTPKTFFCGESEVAIHQVIGIIFDHSLTVENGQDEAVLVDATDILKGIQIAFRVRDQSAVPLALNRQVVLGGRAIRLDELGRYRERLVALTLDDGSSIFKRVGEALPGDLSHLRQFESIGGIGDTRLLAVQKPQQGLRAVTGARSIIGVLYHA